jgi:hypothetical protein
MWTSGPNIDGSVRPTRCCASRARGVANHKPREARLGDQAAAELGRPLGPSDPRPPGKANWARPCSSIRAAARSRRAVRSRDNRPFDRLATGSGSSCCCLTDSLIRASRCVAHTPKVGSGSAPRSANRQRSPS